MLQMGESKTRLTCEDNGLMSVEYKTCVYILVSQTIVCWRRECVCVWMFTWVISGCPRRRYRCIRWCSWFWSRGESVGQLCKSFFVVFNFEGFNNLARFGRHRRCKKSFLWWRCYCRSRVRGDPPCWTFVTVLNFRCPIRIICLYKGILLKVTLLLKLWHCSI